MEIRTIRSQIDKLAASRESLVTDDMEQTLLELNSSLKNLCAFQESLTRLYLQFSAIEDTRSQQDSKLTSESHKSELDIAKLES
jgi:hypothetical protein